MGISPDSQSMYPQAPSSPQTQQPIYPTAPEADHIHPVQQYPQQPGYHAPPPQSPPQTYHAQYTHQPVVPGQPAIPGQPTEPLYHHLPATAHSPINPNFSSDISSTALPNITQTPSQRQPVYMPPQHAQYQNQPPHNPGITNTSPPPPPHPTLQQNVAPTTQSPGKIDHEQNNCSDVAFFFFGFFLSLFISFFAFLFWCCLDIKEISARKRKLFMSGITVGIISWFIIYISIGLTLIF